MKYDFGGYATKNDLRCSDGRTIRSGAFKDCDGATVPLVWQHMHDSPDNILGHALLENRSDGVYAYCSFNSGKAGLQAKELVAHGDINSLSIYANRLKQNGGDVIHGVIREVSLVLSGANPGALIDNLAISHGDGEFEVSEDEAVIYTGEFVNLAHSEEKPESADDKEQKKAIEEEKEVAEDQVISHEDKEGEETVEDVFNTLTDKQKQAVYAIVGAALEDQGGAEDEEDDEEATHYDMEGNYMKYNVFDTEGEENVLSHSDVEAIFADAKRTGSLKDSVLQHGITNIDVMFPEAQLAANQPGLISRNMEWVSTVLNGVRKSPFSIVKSVAANITADEARAKGYIKGNKKVEEQISALKRKVSPTTIYKLQKLDRDDVIDITDFDVVAWIKQEMRTMLDEEVARAILVGDGRPSASNDKIDPLKIIPVWTDDEVYSVHKAITKTGDPTANAKAFIDATIRARRDYKGSGAPTLFVGPTLLTDMRLIRDDLGYRLYKNDQELADELRVSKIVEVEILDNLTREVNGATLTLGGLILNLMDYNVGATRGGEVSLFDDFDLDYNKLEYLIETRCSGALIQPKSALVIEFSETSNEESGEDDGE